MLQKWRHGRRRGSGLTESADGRSALHGAFVPIVEALETRALLSGDADVVADDSQIMESTVVQAPAGVTVTKPLVTIVATDPKAHETDRDRGVFTVSRSGSTNKPLNVEYAVHGVAKNGTDYDRIPKSILIPAGQRSARIIIRPIDDDRVEAPETVKLVITEHNEYAIDTEAGIAKVGIRNNDGPKVNITVTDTSASEANNDRGVFRITRTGSTAEDLTVRFTVYGKATNGVDYERVVEKVVIPAGQASVNVPIRPVNDLHTELSESVRIQLRLDKYLVGEQSKASLSLKDNDANNTAEGVITFRAPDVEGEPGHVFYMPAAIGGLPIDVTRALNQIEGKSREDRSITLSPDGNWMVLHTNRFDTDADDFDLVVYPINNLGGGRLVQFDTGPVQPLGKSAVMNGGDLVVFESTEGPHESDLWATVRTAGSWSKVLLTADSPHQVNTNPSITVDGTRILFTGGTGIGEAILEVKTDGSALRTIIDHNDAPEGSTVDAPIGTADYGPEGSIIFQAGWNGNQIWKLASDATVPTLFSGATNESNPSVLDDGRIVSLWGDRPGNDEHVLELTIRYADGSLLATLLPGVDLPEGGIGVAG